MAPEKDNSFQPNLTPGLDSVESRPSSGEFLEPVEGSSREIPRAEVASIDQPEQKGLEDAIKADVAEGTQVSFSPESSQRSVNAAILNPIAEFFLLKNGDRSPHDAVDKLNEIRKSA